MIDRKIIDILACPASHRPLRSLPASRLAVLNALIESGQATYVDGEKIDRPIEAALVTDNKALIYRIDDDIPVLLVERGIPGRQIID
ncbi:MAG: Trm112 family protein [Gammaproteobacteria bacterium]|nr:Trm112 family protein [Gammaproteobacteria bacterium]